MPDPITSAPAGTVDAPVAPAAPSLGESLYATPPATPASPEAPAAAAATPEAPVPPVEGDPQAPVAPVFTAESYKDLALPEGLEVDESLFGEFKGTLADAGVDPAKAPALLSLYQKTLQAQQDATVAALRAQDATWAAELSSLPEFQGERRTQASNAIGRAIEEFGTPEVLSTLDAYGLGNNPALARFIHNMAKALSEGAPAPVGTPPAATGGRKGKTLGERLYSNS